MSKIHKIFNIFIKIINKPTLISYYAKKLKMRYSKKDKTLFYLRNEPIHIKRKDKSATIIIPVYNGYSHLTKLTESLFKNTSHKTKIIFINDASTDTKVNDLLKNIASKHQNTLVVNNKINYGYTKTINIGMTFVKTKYAIWLNSDTVVPKNWVNKLLIPLWKYPKAASATPFSNSATIFSFPEFNKDNCFDCNQIEQINNCFEYIDNFDKELNKTITGHGFCLAIRRKCYKKIGPLDEIAYAGGYSEENDWCFRAAKNGWNNYLAVNLFIYHFHCGSYNTETKQKLVSNHLAMLHSRYPYYLDNIYSSFVKKDPWKIYRELIINKFLELKNLKYKLVCYTCITGNYDTLNEVEFKDIGVDYICFTDNPNLKSNTWNIRMIPDSLSIYSNVKKQRLIKVLPHKFLSEYDVSLWIDGSIKINCHLIDDFFTKYNYEACSIYSNKHPERKCLYEEAKEVVKIGFQTEEEIKPQVEKYSKEGFPKNFGLFETNLILRKHNNLTCVKVMNDWADEIINGSHRDQLSFTYCLWKNKCHSCFLNEQYDCRRRPVDLKYHFLWLSHNYPTNIN